MDDNEKEFLYNLQNTISHELDKLDIEYRQKLRYDGQKLNFSIDNMVLCMPTIQHSIINFFHDEDKKVIEVVNNIALIIDNYNTYINEKYDHFYNKYSANIAHIKQHFKSVHKQIMLRYNEIKDENKDRIEDDDTMLVNFVNNNYSYMSNDNISLNDIAKFTVQLNKQNYCNYIIENDISMSAHLMLDFTNIINMLIDASDNTDLVQQVKTLNNARQYLIKKIGISTSL